MNNKIDNQDLINQVDPEDIIVNAARTNFTIYSRYINPDLKLQAFHKTYYYILDMFANQLIKKLIVIMPPQHGKSEGSSRNLPSYILGKRPDSKIILVSFSKEIAKNFNYDNQKIITSERYQKVFPGTSLTKQKQSFHNVYRRNSLAFDVIGKKGSFTVGSVRGGVTSLPCDVLIYDDLYKNYEDGNSPIMRAKTWNFYTYACKSRVKDNTQELMVFTRWHKEDVIGELMKREKYVIVKSLEDIKDVHPDTWVVIHFEALKESEPTEIDNREYGEALWPGVHSNDQLLLKRALDSHHFSCLYQGNPISDGGLMYKPFRTYTDKSFYGVYVQTNAYTDFAGKGKDFLCSVIYDVYESQSIDDRGNYMKFILIRDVYCDQSDINVTSEQVPKMWNKNNVEVSRIESNNGGHEFAYIVEPKTIAYIEEFFTPSTRNKEAAIKTYRGLVNRHIIMPEGWQVMWEVFAYILENFLMLFSANERDDPADVLTGIIEKEIVTYYGGL